MSEINSLNPNVYYAGVQNSTNEALKNRKNEKTSSTKRKTFGDLLKTESEAEHTFVTQGFPPEIADMTLEDATVFLKDAVDLAGNDLSEEINSENILKFKSAVSQFIRFVEQNNFEVIAKRRKNRMGHDMIEPSRTNFFSNYSLPPHRATPKVSVRIINEKLDELTRMTLETQMDNLKVLAKADEIKGLIVDLMSS